MGATDMKQALRRNPTRRQTAVGASIPAPTGGWNAQAPIASMPAGDAVILDNWIPRAGYVELRRGSVLTSDNAPGPVESLFAWRGSTEELYGVSDGDVYEVGPGSAGFTASVYTVTSNRVQTTNFANDAGSFTICVNGEDVPFRYNGTDWDDLTITGSSGPITLTPSDLIDVMSHKERLFFIEKDTLRVWYLAINAIQGTAGLLDLGGVFNMGGKLICQGTWSHDGGLGPDDYAVFMTDQGELAVYQGTDPGDPLNWGLVGVFAIGNPLGRRSMFKFGSDLQVLTTQGVFSLAQALSLDRAQANKVAITAKIQNAFFTASESYGTNFGWQGLTYPRGSLAIYNVPITELTESHQYVQNLQTGAWCRFKSLNAFCWATLDDDIYFGGVSAVYQWDVGVTDDGVDLLADLKTAFNYFGDRGSLKRFTMLRPTLNATADVRPAIEMLTDFQERAPTAVPTTIMDRNDILTIRDNWTSVTGLGYNGSVRMQVRIASDPTAASTLSDGDGNDIEDGLGDLIAVDSGDPLTAQIQVLAFNVLYQRGGQL
jgi:hypothetical protein